MAEIDSENDEDVDIISTTEDRRQFGMFGGSRELNCYSNSSLPAHHFGNVLQQAGIDDFSGYQPNRR